jgi:branched-chain amino acid transport system permease protein
VSAAPGIVKLGMRRTACDLRVFVGGVVAAFIISQIIAVASYYESTEWAYVMAFVLFIVMMFARPRGILGR